MPIKIRIKVTVDYKMVFQKEVDHYDAFTFILVGIVSIVASVRFIFLNFVHPKAKKFPGSLLIHISIAEVMLSIHWLATGIATPYISGIRIDKSNEYGTFCVANQYVAVSGAAAELSTQISFFVALIVMSSNQLKTTKFKKLYHIVPLTITICMTFFMRKNFGLNIYGTCSLRNQSILSYLAVIFPLTLLVLYTVYVLKKNMNSNVFVEKNFFGFYISYSLVVLGLYVVAGLVYVFGSIVEDCETGSGDALKRCYQIYFFSKIINNVKIFLPLITLWVRMRDPFISQILKNRRRESDLGMPIDPERTNIEEDFIFNTQRSTMRKFMIKTMLLGLQQYFSKHLRSLRAMQDSAATISNIQYSVEYLEPANLLNFNRETKMTAVMTPVQPAFFLKLVEFLGYEEAGGSFQFERVNFDGNDGAGGASGEFTLKTDDKRFFIKTLTGSELKVFNSFLPDYTAHLLANPKSLIVKIIGVFSFEFEQVSQPVNVFIMENIFRAENKRIMRNYDLKGSSYNRQVGKEEIRPQDRSTLIRRETLKDKDFDLIEEKITLDPATHQTLLTLIANDVQFFHSKRLIDYSLFVAVVDSGSLDSPELVKRYEDFETLGWAYANEERTRFLLIGISDFFQLYTFSKAMEKVWKRIQKVNAHLDTSSQNADVYAPRFMKYMRKIFVTRKKDEPKNEI